MNDEFWWVLTKTRSTHGTHVPWLPGIWWRFNDSRLMTSGLFYCWQERDDTYGGEPSLVCVLGQSQKTSKNNVRSLDWKVIKMGITDDIIAVGSMTCATSKQLKAPDLTQSWGERRDWQQPRYSPCRTPELLEYENGGVKVTRWPGGGLFEEILSWDTSIIQRRSLYLWVASFVSILHGRATSSRAMKWWLAASLSSTSCVSTGFYQRQFQTKNIAFHFAQCNSIQFNLWNGIHFPEQIAPLAERNLFLEKVLLRKDKYWLMFETSRLAGQTLPMSSHDLLGRFGLELRGVARWSKIIIPFSRKFQDSKPPNYTTNDCWNMSTDLSIWGVSFPHKIDLGRKPTSHKITNVHPRKCSAACVAVRKANMSPYPRLTSW